jgi:hypothetical protein
LIAWHRSEISRLEQQQRVELRDTIAAVVGPVAFDARALWSQRWTSRALLEAFEAVNIRNAQQLGKRLRRLPGLERIGADNRGAIWVVRVEPDSHQGPCRG